MTRANAPLACAVYKIAGFPAAGFDAAVVFGTGRGEVVDVGLAVVGPVIDRVMDLTVGPGHRTAGPGAAAVPGKTVSVVHR